jgi:DNA helicase-2/ATP-dependent DNA helicase PcrA
MELVKRNIPYIVRGGMRFFEQAHIKDVLSYLKIVANPADEISWMRALTLCPGIGPGYASRIFERFSKGGANLKSFLKSDTSKIISQKAQAGYKRFLKIMRAVTRSEEETPGEMISLIMEAGYETHVLANFENAKDRVDDIHELINFSHDYKSMQDFLSDITLRENFRGETVLGEREEDEYLVISTIHQAKGLEWDAVIIIGLCEGQFPHPKAMKDISEIEEERRLFYVASTRAKKYLYLMHPATRFDYQMGTVVARRSRFLEELDSKDYEVWEVSSESSRDVGISSRDTEITYQGDNEFIELE